jgi:hypothetical protein
MVEKVEGSIIYCVIFLKMDMWAYNNNNSKKQNGGLDTHLAMANSPTKYYFITLLFENIL